MKEKNTVRYQTTEEAEIEAENTGCLALLLILGVLVALYVQLF